MNRKTEAYNRGLEAGKKARANIRKWMDSFIGWAKLQYPMTRDMDYPSEMVKFDKERLANPPSVTRFPETKGLADLVVAERKGFHDGCGGGDQELAYHFSWFFFSSRRLNTRFVGPAPRANHCTSVYIRDTKEGGPLYGRNLDDIRRPGLEDFQPPTPLDGKRVFVRDGVSSAVMCDEEPEEIFPVDPWRLMPKDCVKLKDVMAFLERYHDFWGPQNGILVDLDQNAAAFEKSNCRVGFRVSEDGTAAVTACSYLIPAMKKFKEERSRISLQKRGWDETSPDWCYWKGCDARYERLLKLTTEAGRRGATLDDMAAIVTDRAVPFPERICLGGQKGHPDDFDVNWTLTSQASVLEGPNCRTLFWRVEGNQACYDNPPFFIPGKGVKVKASWKKNTRSASVAEKAKRPYDGGTGLYSASK